MRGSKLNQLLKEVDLLQDEINSFRPLNKKYLKDFREYFKIGLTYSSNALEGNSLTETETKVVLEDGLTIGGKSLKDHFEAIGHADAFDYLYKIVESGEEINEDLIKRIHYLFYRHIDEENAGNYRKRKVFVTGSKHGFPKPEEVKEKMSKFIGKVIQSEKKHPVVKAARVHKEFVVIHPFIDGNGRVARLLMNLVLMKYNYTIAIIPPILRAEYIRLLEKAWENDSDFCIFIAERVKETQKDYLRLLK